jgi:hypothetical protein
MDKREEREILAAYTDHLIGLGPAPPAVLGRHERVQGLLELADHLQAILVPAEPDANFRRRLHGDLILEAQRRQDEPEPSLFEQHRKGILIGAALGSLASVVGVVIAFVLRYRQGRPTNVAAS